MNEKQLIALSGIIAYAGAGLYIVARNLSVFTKAITTQTYLLIPVFKTFGIILIITIIAIYLLRDKKTKQKNHSFSSQGRK